MDHIIQTLSQAYQLIKNDGQQYSFENICIQNMFVHPSNVEAFHDDKLFLKFIGNLLNEKNNFSFPENPQDYDKYFQDCLLLKKQMQCFSEETWLFCTVRLFENLKTPYYSVYSSSLLSLEQCFSNRQLFLDILQKFYSVIIKSSPEKQQLIKRITKRGVSYLPLVKDEALLSEILLYQLSAFASEKDFWISKLFSELYIDEPPAPGQIDIPYFLEDFQKKEQLFLSLDAGAFDGYFSRRACWFSNNRQPAPENIFLYRQRYTGISPLPSDSFLGKYAYNMTAANYITNPAIERQTEIQDLELILISPKKSPILLGDAGVGKTSVVEGLAWLLQQRKAPDLLKNKQIYKLTTTTLLSGTKYVGEMEERVRQLMQELIEHPDIILFIDEIHTIVGAGSTESSNNDISNMLKPYIDRGNIKIIGSTTKEEYNKYLLTDKALARRFYPIAVEEPDETAALHILMGTIPSIEYETKVQNPFSTEKTADILQTLIRLSAKNNQPKDRLTRLPELPLTLLEMAFSYGALQSRNFVAIEDFICAVRHTNLLKKDIKVQAEQYFL